MADSKVPGTTYEGADRDAPRTTYERDGSPVSDGHGAGARGAVPGTVYEGAGPEGVPGVRRRLAPPRPILEEFEYVRDLSTSGAQADVLLCRRWSDGGDVVVKLYRGLVESFDVDAVETLIELSKTEEGREHIAPILEFRQWEGETWEVQEYFSLGSMKDLYQRMDGPLPRDMVRAVLEELVGAIEFTQGHDVIHRDLTPANILVRSEEPLDLVLADFGLAREQAASRVLGSTAGTWAYMSPEGAAGMTTKATDWWSLGMILYEGLHGRHPFSVPDGTGMRTDKEIKASLGQDLYEIEPTGDERWDLLLRGLLTADAKGRWGSSEVGRWLAGESPAVHTRVRGPRTRVAPFAFRQEHHAPQDLARSFQEASEDAAQFLADPRNLDLLRTWLGQHGLAEEAGPILGGQQAPGAVAVGLQALLDPTTTPTFGDRSLGGKELTKTAREALGGDEAAGRWIRQLRQERALTAWAQQVDDGRAISLADDSLQRWWLRIAALSPDQRRMIGADDPAVEGLLLKVALAPDERERAEKDARKALSRIGEVSDAFRTLTEKVAQDKGDSNFGLRLITANQLPVEQKVEKARRKADQTEVLERRRGVRQVRNRQIRDSAASNFREGAAHWLFVGALPAIFALAVEWRRADFRAAAQAVAPWILAFVVLGGLLHVLRSRRHPRLELLLTGVAVAWLWSRFLDQLMGRAAWLPSPSTWQVVFLALAVVGVLAWASTLGPGFSSESDVGRSSHLQEALRCTGRMQVVLWACVMIAVTQQIDPGAFRTFDRDFPRWYLEIVAAVRDWLSPLAEARPDNALPWGAAGVLLATGALRAVVGRYPLAVRVVRPLLVVIALVLLAVILAILQPMAGAVLLVGAVLTVVWSVKALIAVAKAPPA
ncbi:serine/threonine-protein kinase [Ornithinimicrobium avium]|uniref:serine/threonine-protein kinase n=1 Tax=Ornithinimicrobium avium TaxID=2283195 RepID=UPI0013B3C5B2|nr:protein kinase [Ornithinimicrobium avium]